jgi:A/G-specific adenine glycosylase
VAPLTSRQLARPALAWYRKNHRRLPWRSTRDPYAIWISEIMLQQTQVATVIPYYERFLQRFPHPAALAAAPEEEVFQFWAGLGYYRRARQLHAAAKKILENHEGAFPTTLSEAIALPGIGRYTAHAILSFACDQRLGIVEANTQRLYARLLHWDQPTQSSASQLALWDFANRIVPASNCGEFNQAMMEIGSQICTPRKPACDSCPLFRWCPTGQQGHSDRIPAPKVPKTLTDLTEAVVLVENTSAQWLVRRCGDGERWAGLWDFPRFDVTNLATPTEIEASLREAMRKRFRLDVDVSDSNVSSRHAVTRYRIQLRCYFGHLRHHSVNDWDSARDAKEVRWLSLHELKDLAWNASAKRILKWLQEPDQTDARFRHSTRPNPSTIKAPKRFEYRN